VLVKENHDDQLIPVRSSRFSKGFLSWQKLPTKNISAVALVTPTSLAKAMTRCQVLTCPPSSTTLDQ
jgi:hypothetical protein